MTDTKKPYLFLDLDGVLNVIQHETADTHDPTLFTDHDVFEDVHPLDHPSGFTLTVSRSLVKALCELDELVEVLWLTTWEQSAPQIVAPLLGLPAWPVCGHPKLTSTWKLGRVVDQLLEDPHPWIWADDDEADREAELIVVDSSGCDERRLLLQPDESRGLDRADIEAVKAFAADR